jgi:phosphoglucosamine mutase
MEKKLFGTDGIRGVAGEPPLDPKTVFVIGRCLGEYLRPRASVPRVLVAEDTRESSRWIAETLAAGLSDSGVAVATPGVLTTPGLAYVTAAEGFTAGVMVSASHNPYQDNGLKVFASSGFKLPDEDELVVEGHIFVALTNGRVVHPHRRAMEPSRLWANPYVAFLRQRAQGIGGSPARRVVVDCANGSAALVAREVFAGFDTEWTWLADAPDGKNINLRCGSLHLENLRAGVLQAKADLGIAFDGDADRALFVSGEGRIVNGDGVLLAAARYLKQRGALRGGAVVGTTMSNLGLEHALAREGLRLLRTPVGDKYVLEEMLRSGANLGGEQSGHIIFRDLATTGDGLLTAIELLRITAEKGQTLEQLLEGLEEYPQAICNVRVREKIPLEELPPVMDQIRASERSLGTAGRIVVRYSGTELVARVMVEAQTDELVRRHTAAIARAIEKTVGSESSVSSE